MDYQKLYNNLVDSARKNSEGYLETHHIVPKCMGGNDDKDNLVKMTARQHFIAHWLLYKIYRSSTLAHAWFSMCRCGAGQDERYVNSKHFAKARAALSIALSESMRGNNNGFFGKKHTEESKRKIREKRKLQVTTEETKRKMSETRTGVVKSEEHRRKIGESGKGKVPLKNVETGESVRVDRSELYRFDPNIWKNPFAMACKEQPKSTCPHCGKTSNSPGNMKRWHFDKCKEKK